MISHDLGTLEGDVLLFGGPYGNLQASAAMQARAELLGLGPQNSICNGDVVAYCGEPEQTVDLIRSWGVHTVMGNCEESVGNQQQDCGCGFDENTLCSALSVQWYRFVSGRVSAGNRLWMRALPRTILFQLGDLRFAVIHGGIGEISEFVFLSSDRDKKYRDAELMDVDCVIGGHCGLPFGETIEDRHWLNTGVIGMPANDGTTDGWYLLLHPDDSGQTGAVTASWHRLGFDTRSAMAAMQAAGLGHDYRDALGSGLWPSMDILPDAERNARGQRLNPAPLALLPIEQVARPAIVA